MTRSELFSLDRAKTAGSGTGVDAAPAKGGARAHAGGAHAVPADGTRDGEAVAEAVRCELARLTALLRRHFSQGGEDSLLPALAETSDPVGAAGARAFLDQISDLATDLERHAGNWSTSPSVADASADFRRETMAVLRGVEDRLEGKIATASAAE